MNSSPLITDEDRQRGWAELEVVYQDGSKESLRIHEMTLAQMPALLGAPLEDALAVVLRKPKAEVARIRPEYQLAIAQMQAAFLLGEAGAKEVTAEAAGHAIAKMKEEKNG